MDELFQKGTKSLISSVQRAANAPPAVVQIAKKHNALRPSSVDLDLSELTLIRQQISRSTAQVNDLIELEKKSRQQIDQEAERSQRHIDFEVNRNLVYVRYLDAQRQKEKAKHELTNKVHLLFAESLEKEKIAKEEKKLKREEASRMQADEIRREVHVLTTRFHKKAVDTKVELQAVVRAQREAAHTKQYRANLLLQEVREQRAQAVKHEAIERRRGVIVDKAFDIHKKKNFVQQLRAQSTSPTLFLKLPPMREVFNEDVLEFEPQTLLTRHYQSTYAVPHFPRSHSSSMRSTFEHFSSRGGVHPRSVSTGVGTE